MKSLRHLLAIAAATCALTLSAKADLYFYGAVNFHNGPNDPTTNAQAAARFLINHDPSIVVFELLNNYETGLNGPVDATNGELFVVHYGPGQGGVGEGSLEFFWAFNRNGETGSVTFPQIGNGASNPDRFGHGEIVSARGFSVAIVEPDAGATVLLFIVALTFLGLARRLAA